MTPILAFDIETIPDVNGIRLLHDLPTSMSDQEVVSFAQQRRRAQTGAVPRRRAASFAVVPVDQPPQQRPEQTDGGAAAQKPRARRDGVRPLGCQPVKQQRQSHTRQRTQQRATVYKDVEHAGHDFSVRG